MSKRRKNELSFTEEHSNEAVQQATLSLPEAREMFLRDLRGLAKETRRWHTENLRALESILAKQGIVVEDIEMFNPRLLKDHFVFYMLETMHLKTNTINGRVRSVRALIKFLEHEGYLKRDFSADVPMLKGERVIIQSFSTEQIVTLLQHPNRHTFTGLRDYTILLILLETGIRISECINIRLSDIRLQDGQILIRGKGAKERLVPFQSEFKKALQHYLQVRGGVATDSLFITVDDKPISKRYVQEVIQKYGEAAHITDVRVSPHTFRHTMAKFYILAGCDILSLQRILGHSSLETVRLYVELFSSDVQTQHKRFSFVENQL